MYNFTEYYIKDFFEISTKSIWSPILFAIVMTAKIINFGFENHYQNEVIDVNVFNELAMAVLNGLGDAVRNSQDRITKLRGWVRQN